MRQSLPSAEASPDLSKLTACPYPRSEDLIVAPHSSGIKRGRYGDIKAALRRAHLHPSAQSGCRSRNMLGSAVPATATLHTTTTPLSPTRPSRLRGLSYLRSYTHHHLHPPALTRSTSSPAESVEPARGRSEAERGTETPTLSRGVESGWNRESLHPPSTSAEAAAPEPNSSSVTLGMSRSRAVNALAPTPTSLLPASAARRPSAMDASGSSDPFMTGTSASSQEKEKEPQQLPTIRFIPHLETRSSRPSLHFTALSRTLKTSSSIVRVGRYSERDNNPTNADPSGLPVGFKSKVVSRRHCEFWCSNGQWHVKDVKSSSGTFLNHVRLSSPGVESRPFPVNDGDVVQLGIDFKGGEEVIFRCVKIRIECNRGWQKSLNTYNTTAHKRLLNNALNKKSRDSDAQSVNSSECSICLNPVAPCQALFVAPCSHVWHYKCVRDLIHGPSWPNFLCPNCRFVADLDADVEPVENTEDEFDYLDGNGEYDEDGGLATGAEREMERTQENSEDDAAVGRRSRPENGNADAPPRLRSLDRTNANITDDELAGLLGQSALYTHTNHFSSDELAAAPSALPETSTRPMTITNRRQQQDAESFADLEHARSATPPSTAQFALAAGVINGGRGEGPLTPRNDAGPFVLDGSAGRGVDE